jgi:hypothetical protein
MSRSTEILFVIAAHVPDAQNAALLRETLLSISKWHPACPILCVDNASPPGAVQTALRGLLFPLPNAILLHSLAVSHGQVGSWLGRGRWLMRCCSH